MAFTLWALLEAGLLIVNAICVLHEQRFLAKGKKKNVSHEINIKCGYNVTFDLIIMRLAANYIIICYLSRLGIK